MQETSKKMEQRKFWECEGTNKRGERTVMGGRGNFFTKWCARGNGPPQGCMDFWRKKKKCGTNTLGCNGSNVVIQTHVFSMVTTCRKRQNFIKGLRDENGTWQSKEQSFSGLLTDFYEKLFTSSNPHNMDRIVDGV